MDSENIANAITLRMKKSTRTAFWYQLNDLIEKIKLYKARFKSKSPNRNDRNLARKLKKSFKKGFGTNKTLYTSRAFQNNNEFESQDKTCKLNKNHWVFQTRVGELFDVLFEM